MTVRPYDRTTVHDHTTIRPYVRLYDTYDDRTTGPPYDRTTMRTHQQYQQYQQYQYMRKNSHYFSKALCLSHKSYQRHTRLKHGCCSENLSPPPLSWDTSTQSASYEGWSICCFDRRGKPPENRPNLSCKAKRLRRLERLAACSIAQRQEWRSLPVGGRILKSQTACLSA